MNLMKHIFCYTVLLGSADVLAAQNCNNGGNVASQLHPANTSHEKDVKRDMTSSDPTTNVVIQGQGYIQSSQLIKCDDFDSQSRTKTPTFKSFSNSNINSQSKTFNGKKFYKIVGTADAFVNKYAYIYFRYSDNNNSAKGPYELGNQNGSILGENTYTQGLRIYDLAVAFEKAPIDPIEVPVIIGTLDVSWTKKLVGQDNSYTTSTTQRAEIRLIVNPVVEKTCTVNNPVVTLPTISVATLNNQGDTAAKTNFTIVATCGESLANIGLNSIVVDNSDVDAQSANAKNGILVNTASSQASKNVAIQMYEDTTNQPVRFGLEQDFGKTTMGVNPTARRNYYAKYYKLDSTPTQAGKITSTATIMVTYK
ncbi:fimbrial protein [Acinetobacter larvae]|uniref:Fimbrial-type adhesion domain-containing protein n=1 Tax=Acinetobacter larvae TaxID=1789224 RepID=A0A1B2LWK7_9GAMM|nr:fimbrial protein [Acinetobacter larvae]AOA57330.1 hypothetical protein BFG52_02465 [Acinetobacter larvae]